ncbi:MAG: hypothetical protein HYW89_02410 [Candidatus Sungiibacteriota bacterium]|uniref:Uncharacterized protein n=1 Tax=Candidatus Sungiibacteriota bacterium TaxID=2750080 RepID=A0A7T5RKB8_9BACT|nr:MAG: hypothetical protein HYW89_02410 [Candidatus Sungbacteria bacterium]
MEQQPTNKESERKEDLNFMTELAQERQKRVSGLLNQLLGVNDTANQADILRELAVESGGLNKTIENMIKRVHKDIKN